MTAIARATSKGDGSLLSEGSLVCTNLCVEIAGKPLVSDINMTLSPGLAIAIIGPSGAGKSTLARALVGLENGMRGSLRFSGQELCGASRDHWKPLRRQVQLCWQDPLKALDPRLSALASINESRLLAGMSTWTGSSEDLLALCDELGLDCAELGRRPAALSGGQRQRVALARALACRPSLLIADEITSALDRPLAIDITRRLAARVRDGLGLLLITHDLSLLPGWIDQALVLDRGKIIERASPELLLSAPRQALTRSLRDALPRLLPKEPPVPRAATSGPQDAAQRDQSADQSPIRHSKMDR
ncbi:MAG TPA: ATP-binding cassette domain-containing protein [Nannocystis exedens]|nr:ATP-binding cassette domain-containing protein [Nannocystis exedens]